MIQVTTLENRQFFISAWGMSMTSRKSYDPEFWIVVEDKGATCIIAEIKNGKPSENFRKEWTREQVEKQLQSHPCYKHVGGYQITL